MTVGDEEFRRSRLSVVVAFSLSESHSTTLWILDGNIIVDTFVDSSDSDLQREHSFADVDTLSSTVVADLQSSSTDLQFAQCSVVIVRCRQHQSSTNRSCLGLLVLPSTANSRSSSSDSLDGSIAQ